MQDHVVGIGILGLLGAFLVAWLEPEVIGSLLMLFSVLAFVLGVVGLLRPSLMKLPNRMAATWIFTLAFGMFIAGGMLISPPNGNGAASDAPSRNLPGGLAVTESTWTDSPWPFTEDAGTIVCDRVSGAEAVFFVTDDGKRWPLNGVARMNADQLGAEREPNPIWRRPPGSPDSRVSVGPMISFARETCRGAAAPPRRRIEAAPASRDTVILCHNYVRARVRMSGTGVRMDFPAFMDGARGAQHLGGTEYAFESYVDLIDGQESTRLHYHCRVENGAVIAFTER